MIIISFITIFDSICSPDAEIKEVTCSRYINDIIPDGLASSDSDECMHGIIVDIYTMQINTILLYYISWKWANNNRCQESVLAGTRFLFSWKETECITLFVMNNNTYQLYISYYNSTEKCRM